jgi:hypothetical protein
VAASTMCNSISMPTVGRGLCVNWMVTRQPASAVVVEDGRDLFGGRRGWKPRHHGALDVDEELLEVPRDVGAVARSRLLRLEPGVQGRRTGTVDLDLGEHRERHAVLRCGELQDLRIGARLLSPELVAREAEHDEVVVVVMERTQTCVLGGEASTAGDVDDEADLAPEPVERHRLSGDRGHLELVEG